MMNALFVLIVFLLTLKKDYLHIKWPFGVKTNITYDESTQEVIITGCTWFYVHVFLSLDVDRNHVAPNHCFTNMFFFYIFTG